MTANSIHPREKSTTERVDDATDVDVLVVGAGPTGLTAAVEALRHGLTVRIVERKPQRGVFSKALVVHARTMEVFAVMGIDGDIRKAGTPFAALNLHFNNRKKRVHVDLLAQPWGDTAFPFWLSVPQHDTERVLENRLNDLGGQVEWSTGLHQLTDHGSYVEATLVTDTDPVANSKTSVIRAGWVIGCDGGRSTVREQAGIALKRTGAGATFLLADVKTTSDLIEDEGHMFLAPEGLLILVPMPEPRRWRMIAHVPSGAENLLGSVDAAQLDALISDRAGITFGAHDVTWTSQFDLSHGVADRFRSGRVVLAGDAAHIHSPVGGQGLNTGVQDAHNVMWRIAESRAATPERAEELLAEYESERQGTAGAMVGGVARMTALMTSPRFIARRIRSLVAPIVVSRPFVQAKLARGVGMLNLSYSQRRHIRGSGKWGAGNRLPNPSLRDGGRLYDRVSKTGYSWVVFSNHAVTADAGDGSTPRWMGLPVVVLDESDLQHGETSPRSAAVVLVRPDRYIAAAGADPDSLGYAVPSRGRLLRAEHGN
ncbi:FAD-dependent oxidoreductase [Salinibacterium sp. UTAS2018]|uniref:FAD-dependent monooxygenase n=1 Tax=Salinibacterium sp. UTAS2018 TaxID=2508880 RepID=UPI001009578C|nr:FAD-dependent monooxygenase [Salinibacterium sp. UTAS2018]QAV70996.1 FAD-dependent oxidoreductase [Salinibacterium sp. UTAS2018]